MDDKLSEKTDLGQATLTLNGPVKGSSLEASEAADGAYTPEEDGKLLRRLDYILMPLMCISYGIQFADKTSLSYSALFGLLTDNNLKGPDFALLTTIFYLGYLLAEWPLVYLMQRYSTGAVLGLVMVIWGGLVMCIAACKGFASLMVVRFLIGASESAITPGFLILISQYYTTSEHGSRVLIWSSMNQGFATFMGILIYGLGKHSLDTPGSLPGWKTINLFLGAITCAWGLVVFFFLGSPDRVRWLTASQKTHVKARIVSSKTNSQEVHTWNWGQVRECFRDPQVYFIAAFTFLISMPNGGLVTFQSLIIKGLGFSSLNTILLSMPISAFSVSVFVCLIFFLRKNPNIRILLIAFFVIPPFAGLLALAVLPTHSSKWGKYATLFTLPIFAVSLFLSWSLIPSNIAGRTKKSAVSAVVFISYCAGNAVGPLCFRAQDAPRYIPGLLMSVVCFGLNFIIALVWRQYYVRVNAKRERQFVEDQMDQETIQRLGAEAGEQDLTDLENRFFRYAI